MFSFSLGLKNYTFPRVAVFPTFFQMLKLPVSDVPPPRLIYVSVQKLIPYLQQQMIPRTSIGKMTIQQSMASITYEELAKSKSII